MPNERIPLVTFEDGAVTLAHVRDYSFSQTETLSQGWIDAIRIAPTDIKRIWFGYSGFSKVKVVGHTFVSFELHNDEAYVLSVEISRKNGERYSPFTGLFPVYGLLYGWGTERDYMGMRIHRLQQPVELYPLLLSEEEAQAVFVTFMEETHRIAQKPRFYNTLTSNCASELARAINRKYPGRIPYSLAQHLPGLAVGYMQRIGLIAKRQRVIIPSADTTLLDAAAAGSKIFSTTLRNVLTTL